MRELFADYAVSLSIHPEVHDQGEPCTWCALLDATVQANVYTPDLTGERELTACCLECIVPVVREKTRGDGKVHVELARTHDDDMGDVVDLLGEPFGLVA